MRNFLNTLWNVLVRAVLLEKEKINTMAFTVEQIKAAVTDLVTQETAFEAKVATDLAAIAKTIEDLKAAGIPVSQADLDTLGGQVAAVSAGLTKVGADIDAAANPAPTPTV